MDINKAANYTVVTLSERNLEELMRLWTLAQLGEAVPALHRRTPQGLLTVLVEDNHTHYQNRTTS
jgi:hypothetical protein